MHYRFAQREASQRKGRQIIATLQAAGVGRRGDAQSRQHERETRGLNFSFAIKAMSPPLLVVSETPVLPRGFFHRPCCREKGKLSRDNGADYGDSKWLGSAAGDYR